MLSEIECRALSAVHHVLLQDFEPNDALIYLENSKIFNEDHCDIIKSKTTRLERISCFLRIFRRQANDLSRLIDFFAYNNQSHISIFLDEFVQFSITDPDQLREVVIAPRLVRDMMNRKLLLGAVPRQMTGFQRVEIVDTVIDKLKEMADIDCFFLFLHGRAGAGKTVIASQALSKSDEIIGLCFESVVWMRCGEIDSKSNFDIFSDLLLMLKSEDDLMNCPNLDNVTSMVLKKMIANALIDRPNTLIVFDDVILEETIRWAQELRLRCIITTRDIGLANVASITVDFVEVPPLDEDECGLLLQSFGMPHPIDDSEMEILSEVTKLSSGSPALLSIMNQMCDPKDYDRLDQLVTRLETRGLSAISCNNPYRYKSFDLALRRCVELMTNEERTALGYAVVIPPGEDIPLTVWAQIIPIELCCNDASQIEEEVGDMLNRLAKKGDWFTVKLIPYRSYCIDHVIHHFLRHVVDHDTISSGISILESRLNELYTGNNNQKLRGGDYFGNCPVEEYADFMKRHHRFYDALRKICQR
ncbi:unnamed protein product [Caenorhabditis bovis]|uniref:CARD domain-containing protein n=1 Tax=Caenorhabditis bovis TaxID=2654633 RepID=A0A8S1EFP4_9PELO|nr:unnamed protein product [Caenorhabditis bovis]